MIPPYTHAQNRSLSWLGTGTSVKSGRVKLLLRTQTHQMQSLWYCIILLFLVFNYRSVIEPIRNTIFRQPDHFHLSYATKLDTANKKIYCESVLKSDLKYAIDYDKLVIGVGALSNTFNVPGVQQHAFFLKVY